MNQDISASIDIDDKLPVPTSGLHLSQILDVLPDEGVVVAVLTDAIDEVTTKEIPYTDKHGEYMHAVLFKSNVGTRAMDVIAPSDEKVKWWKAKAMLCDSGVDTIPIRWEGPISEIPQQYFDRDYVLAIRFYDAGPWFFPKEQPKTTEQKKIEEALNDDNK